MRRVAVRGGIAVGASQAVRIGTPVVSVVILARLLQPSDFGIMASVAPIVAFVALFQGLGLQQAIVQQRDLPDEQLTRIFWVTVAVSVACAAIIAAAAPGVAAFYRDDRLTPLTIGAALPLVLAGLGSQPAALLNRDLRFGALALIEGGCAIIGVAVAVLAAWAGAGYWSLLAATLAGNVVNVAACWAAAGWRPGPPSFRLPSRALLGFGANLTGFTFVNFFARNLDNILIGRVWGAVTLGFYDRGYSIMMFPLQAISGPVTRVMVPILSRIQADKPQLRAAYLRTATQLALVTMPGMAALAAGSTEAIELIFGPRWAAIGPIFAWLGLAGLLNPIGNSTGWLFIAQGRTRAMFHWGLYASATAIGAFFAGLPWGAEGVAAAYAISEFTLRSPVLYVVMGRLGPVSTADYARLLTPLLAAAGATWLLHRYFLQMLLGLQGTWLLAATVVLSYALAVAALAALPSGRAGLGDTLSLVAQVLRLRRPTQA